MPSDPEVRRWIWSPEEDVRTARLILRKEPLIPKVLRTEARRMWTTAVVLTCGAGIGVFIAARSAGNEIAFLAASLSLVLAAPAVMYARSVRTPWRKAVEEVIKVPSLRGSESVEISARLSNEGLRLEHNDGTHIYPWHLLACAVVEEQGIHILFTNAFNGVFVPRRAFHNFSACEEFARLLNERLHDCGEHEEQKVLRALDETSIQCAVCDYNLKRLTQLRCPECGHAPSILTLTCMRYLGLLPTSVRFSKHDGHNQNQGDRI